MDWDLLSVHHNFSLYLVTGLVILCQLAVIVLSIAARREKEPGSLFQWACISAVVAPIAIALVMVFLVHYKRIAGINAINYASAAQEAVLLEKGISDPRSFWVLGGFAFCGIAMSSLASILASWLRMRRTRKSSILPLVAFSGLSLTELVLGIGLLARSISLLKSYSAVGYADASEKTMLLDYAYAKAPGVMPFVLVVIALSGITGLIIAGLVAVRKEGIPRLGKWSVATSAIFLLFGVSVYIATRDHARDANSTSELYRTMPHSPGILFFQRDTRLPELKNTKSIRQAPVITVGAGQVVIEGRSVGRLDDIAADENPQIPDLRAVLENLIQNYRLLHPDREFEGLIILQCDRDAPGQAVAKVLWTCYQAGYRKVQIPTDGLLKASTAVLGDYVRYRPEAVHFQLTEHPAGGLMRLPGKDEFWQWAAEIDKAAAGGNEVLVNIVRPI